MAGKPTAQPSLLAALAGFSMFEHPCCVTVNNPGRLRRGVVVTRGYLASVVVSCVAMLVVLTQLRVDRTVEFPHPTYAQYQSIAHLQPSCPCSAPSVRVGDVVALNWTQDALCPGGDRAAEVVAGLRAARATADPVRYPVLDLWASTVHSVSTFCGLTQGLLRADAESFAATHQPVLTMLDSQQMERVFEPLSRRTLTSVRRAIRTTLQLRDLSGIFERPLTGLGIELQARPVAVFEEDVAGPVYFPNATSNAWQPRMPWTTRDPYATPEFQAYQAALPEERPTVEFLEVWEDSPNHLMSDGPTTIAGSRVDVGTAGDRIGRAIMTTLMPANAWRLIAKLNGTCTCFTDYSCSVVNPDPVFTGLPINVTLMCSALSMVQITPADVFFAHGGWMAAVGLPSLVYDGRSRFATIGDAIDAAFVSEDQWSTAFRHDALFERCTPAVCRYTASERRPAGETVGLLVGFLGGIATVCRVAAGLVFGVWNAMSATSADVAPAATARETTRRRSKWVAAFSAPAVAANDPLLATTSFRNPMTAVAPPAPSQ